MVSLLPVLTPEQADFYRDWILKEVDCMPEFVQGSKGPRVLGGFAALGNPGSYHNDAVRSLWKLIYPVATGHFRSKHPDMKIEGLRDRTMIRQPGQAPQKEAWHQDLPKDRKDGDHFYGGWINLDREDQNFVCVTKDTSGIDFGVKPNQGYARYTPELMKWCEENKETIKIPCGHLLIFSEHTPHCINPIKARHTMVRMFAGWRITHCNEPLYPLVWMDNFGIPRLPSGQYPVMYSSNHSSAFMVRQFRPAPGSQQVQGLVGWSKDNVVPQAMYETPSGYTVCRRIFPSLSEMGILHGYKAWGQEERNMSTPT